MSRRAPRFNCVVCAALLAVVAGCNDLIGLTEGSLRPEGEAATLFVATTGSDAGPCTRDAPCKTFQRAYDVAAPGAIVEVAEGDYGTQAVAGEKAAPGVVLRPASGAKVGLAALVVRADHLEVRDMAIRSWETHVESDGFTAKNVDCDVFAVYGSSNTSVLGGDVGPVAEAGVSANWITYDDGSSIAPKNVLVDGVIVHDFTKSTLDDPKECLFLVGGDGITIRNSRFVRCDSFAIFAGTPWWAGSEDFPPITNVTIENNFFDASTVQGGYECVGTYCAYYSVRFEGGWSALDHVRVAYNSSKQPLSFGDAATPRENFVVVGNSVPLEDCLSGVSYRYNAFTGTSCASSDRLVPALGFASPDAAEPDLHLVAGSPAIDCGDPSDAPASDIDGEPRPKGPRPDCGADELQ